MVEHLFLRCGGMTLGFIRKYPMQTVLKRLQYGLHGMLTEHSPVEALIQKCTIQCVLRYIAKFLNIIGSGTGNRFSPQTHDDERDKEGAQSKTLNLLKLEIPNDFTNAKCLHNY